MLDKLRFYGFIKKIDMLISEPAFKKKLFDLIPNVSLSSVKVNLKASTLNITRNSNNSIDNLLIKIEDNTIMYYYYSTNDFNEYGKIYNSKSNIITKYCYYDISNDITSQRIKTDIIICIYDNDLKETYKYIQNNIENYVILDGKKVFCPSIKSDDNSVLTTKKQIRTNDDKIITIVETKYYNDNLKKKNSIKYYVSTQRNTNSKFIPYNSDNKKLTKKAYLRYVKRNSAK